MKRWSEEEVPFLRNNFNKYSNKDLSNLLGKTELSISYKLNHLKLTRNFSGVLCVELGCGRVANKRPGGKSLCSKHLLKKYRQTEKGKSVMVESSKKYRMSILGRYKYAKKDAERRNIIFELTYEEYKNLLEDRKCHYNCGNLISDTCTGLDRLDSSQGRTFNNVVICCRNCNVLKSNILTEEETFAVVEILKKLRNKEDIWNNTTI